MDLSIIIVNWNTSELLIQCLESIYRAQPHLSFEIIVVDNGSVDDSVSAIASRFPAVHIIGNERNLGFAKANNQALSVAKGRYFLLLNSDTLVVPNSLDELVHVADNHLDVGVVAPKLLNMDGSLQGSWSAFPTFWSELIGKNIPRRETVVGLPFAYEVDWVMGACMLVRGETVADVGMLDEDYFFYSEETDWCFRIKNRGWKVWYISNAEIYHLGGGSAKRNTLLQMALLYQSKIHYFHKFHGFRRAKMLRYGLAMSNFFGLLRRIVLLNGKDREGLRTRIKVQSSLIRCLLANRFPEVNR
jgi:GT2 family glycosyltransferase